MEQDQLKAAEEALDELRQGMEVDGYRMLIEGLRQGTLAVRVEAMEGACEECLVPKEIMASIIQTSLPASLGVDSVDLTYPVEHSSH